MGATLLLRARGAREVVLRLARTYEPTCRPSARPWLSPLWKWMPPYRRDQPASSAAAVNVGHDRVTSVAGVFDSNFDESAGTAT